MQLKTNYKALKLSFIVLTIILNSCNERMSEYDKKDIYRSYIDQNYWVGFPVPLNAFDSKSSSLAIKKKDSLKNLKANLAIQNTFIKINEINPNIINNEIIIKSLVNNLNENSSNISSKKTISSKKHQLTFVDISEMSKEEYKFKYDAVLSFSEITFDKNYAIFKLIEARGLSFSTYLILYKKVNNSWIFCKSILIEQS